MSESTAEKRSSSRSSRKVRSATNAELPFWAISITLHALLIGGVLMFPPVRKIVFRRQIEEPEVITRGDELENVIDQIRDRTVEQLRSRVALLESGQDRMATNFATLNEFYQPFVAQQRATARRRMEKYIADVLPHQDQLRQLIEAARNGGTPAKAVSFSHEWNSRILTGQEEIRRGMMLLKLGGPELLKEQREAEEAQYEVSQFMRWLDDSLNAIENAQKKLAELETELAARKDKVPVAEAAEFQAKVAEKDAEAAYREGETRQAALAKSDDKEAQRAAKQASDEAKRALAAAKRQVAEAAKALQRANEEVTRTTSEITKVEARLVEVRGKRDEHLRVGHNIQTGAYHRQQHVVDTLRSLLAESAPNE